MLLGKNSPFRLQRQGQVQVEAQGRFHGDRESSLRLPLNLYKVLRVSPTGSSKDVPNRLAQRVEEEPLWASSGAKHARNSILHVRRTIWFFFFFFPKPLVSFQIGQVKRRVVTILQHAASILGDPYKRREYDDSLATEGEDMEIPAEQLPGALFLLQVRSAFLACSKAVSGVSTGRC